MEEGGGVESRKGTGWNEQNRPLTGKRSLLWKSSGKAFSAAVRPSKKREAGIAASIRVNVYGCMCENGCMHG